MYEIEKRNLQIPPKKCCHVANYSEIRNNLHCVRYIKKLLKYLSLIQKHFSSYITAYSYLIDYTEVKRNKELFKTLEIRIQNNF